MSTRDIDHAIVVLYNVYRGPVPGTQYLQGTHDEHGLPKREYVHKRFSLFLDSVMRSLVNQRSRNFFVVFMHEHQSDFGTKLDHFRAEARRHLDFPVTFAPIPPINFTTDWGYRNAFWSRRPAEEEAIRQGCRGRKWLYVTYLDGDDFLRDDYVEKVQQASCRPEHQAVVPMHGYAFDSVTCRLRYFDRGACPPFFTLRYLEKNFFQGTRWNGGPGRHLFVPDKLRVQTIPNRVFAQHIHESNDSTAFDMPGGGAEVLGSEKRAALRRFGWPDEWAASPLETKTPVLRPRVRAP